MKNMNIKIALVALASLFATGHSMANESGLLSTNSSVGKYSYFSGTTNSKREAVNKLFGSPKLIDAPLILIAQCTLPGSKNEKGILCKTGQCVKSADLCPGKPHSPSYKETTLDSEGI